MTVGDFGLLSTDIKHCCSSTYHGLQYVAVPWRGVIGFSLKTVSSPQIKQSYYYTAKCEFVSL